MPGKPRGRCSPDPGVQRLHAPWAQTGLLSPQPLLHCRVQLELLVYYLFVLRSRWDSFRSFPFISFVVLPLASFYYLIGDAFFLLFSIIIFPKDEAPFVMI